jgi:predicted Fe-S protein YdhL (DUF1289 family)
MSESVVQSPCIKACRLSPITGLCGGCLRTIDEIARWGNVDDMERARVLAAIAERRATYARGPDLVRDNERK